MKKRTWAQQADRFFALMDELRKLELGGSELNEVRAHVEKAQLALRDAGNALMSTVDKHPGLTADDLLSSL